MSDREYFDKIAATERAAEWEKVQSRIRDLESALDAQARELAAARAALAACRAARESLRLGMTLMQTHYAADKPGVWVVGSELAPELDEVVDYLSTADTALADAERAGTEGG